VLIGYAEALGAAKAATIQSGGDINPNQELVAHGPANAALRHCASRRWRDGSSRND